MLTIRGEQAAGLLVELKRELAVRQHLTVGRTQERGQQASALGRVGRVPIHVEILGVRAGAAPFQHVLPPRVVCATHAHVVGHDVQHEAHRVVPQRRHQPPQRVLAAQLGIDALMVHDVIAVRGPGARREQR